MASSVNNKDNFCGYLVKQGGAQGGFKSWKQRWFVIHDHKLSYYKDDSCKEQCGSINLQDSVVLDCTLYDEHDYLQPVEVDKSTSRATDESISNAFVRNNLPVASSSLLMRHNTAQMKSLDNSTQCKECGIPFTTFALLSKNAIKKTACRKCQFNFCQHCLYERLLCDVCNEEDASDAQIHTKYEYVDNPLFLSSKEAMKKKNASMEHLTQNSNAIHKKDTKLKYARGPQKRHAKVHYPTLTSQALETSKSNPLVTNAHIVKLDIDARNITSLRQSLQLNVLLRNTLVPHVRIDQPTNLKKNLFAISSGSRTLWQSCPSVDAKKTWIKQIHMCARDDAYIFQNWPKLIWPRIHEIEITSVIETSKVKNNPLQDYNLFTMNNPFDMTKLGLITVVFGKVEPGNNNLQCIIDSTYMAELAQQEYETMPTKTAIVSNVLEMKADFSGKSRRQSIPMYISSAIMEESLSMDSSIYEEEETNSLTDTIAHTTQLEVKQRRNMTVYPTMSMKSNGSLKSADMDSLPELPPQPENTRSPSVIKSTPAQSAKFTNTFLTPGSLALGPKVGGGAYGDVYKGFLWGTQVAAKTLKHETKQVPFRWIDQNGIAMIALSAAIVPILHAIQYWKSVDVVATRQKGDEHNSNEVAPHQNDNISVANTNVSASPTNFDTMFTPQRRATLHKQRTVYSTISSKYHTIVPGREGINKKQLMNLAAIPLNAIQLGITPDQRILCVAGEQVLTEISANSCESVILDDLCKEINILSQLRHPNVVQFMGVTIDIPLHLINTHAYQFYVAKVKKMNLLALTRATSITVNDQERQELDQEEETTQGESIFLYIRDDLVDNKKLLAQHPDNSPVQEGKPQIVPSDMIYSPINPAESVGICLITEWCELGSLFDILYDYTIPLSSKQCLEIAMGVAQGLNYQHKLQPKIVHRDVKSQNILVDSYFNVKVTDFGLSFNTENNKYSPTDDTFHGVFGTPEWLAPEMIVGLSYNEKIDCYSYGVLLTEIFARQQPYVDILPNVSYETVSEGVILNGMQPTIPSWSKGQIGNVIFNCLQREPKQRMHLDQIIMELHTLQNLSDSTFLLDYDIPRIMEMLSNKRNRMIQSLGARELTQLCQSQKIYIQLDLGTDTTYHHDHQKNALHNPTITQTNLMNRFLNSQIYSCYREEKKYTSTDAGRFLNRYSRIQYQRYKEEQLLRDNDYIIDEKEQAVKSAAAAQEQIRIEAYNTLTGDSVKKQRAVKDRILEKNIAHTRLRHEDLQVRILDDDLVHILSLQCNDLSNVSQEQTCGTDVDFDNVTWILSYLECLWGILDIAKHSTQNNELPSTREWCCEFISEEGLLLPLMYLSNLQLENEFGLQKELEGMCQEVETQEMIQGEVGYSLDRHAIIQDRNVRIEFITHIFKLYAQVRGKASDLLLFLLRNISLENIPRLFGEHPDQQLLQTVLKTVKQAKDHIQEQVLAQGPSVDQMGK